jgi:hypothetical protein
MRITNRSGQILGIVAMMAVSRPAQLRAQEPEPKPSRTGMSRTLAAIASTPLGALTSVGPFMATSRDDKFLLGFRFQYGSRQLAEGRSLTSYGFTTDLQIEGGAVISGTLGYQRGENSICGVTSCDTDRMMAGLRYSKNVVTTRPFLRVPFFTDNDASGTAALELGAGWANKGFGDNPHWTADITVPLSLAVGQRTRIVVFATPAVAVAWGTTERRWSRGQRFLTGGGVTIQEIGRWVGIEGIDVTVAAQRAFSPLGTTLGGTVSYMHVP